MKVLTEVQQFPDEGGNVLKRSFRQKIRAEFIISLSFFDKLRVSLSNIFILHIFSLFIILLLTYFYLFIADLLKQSIRLPSHSLFFSICWGILSRIFWQELFSKWIPWLWCLVCYWILSDSPFWRDAKWIDWWICLW